MKTVTEFAQQIADQELEACCEWLRRNVKTFTAAAHLEAQRRSDELRAARALLAEPEANP